MGRPPLPWHKLLDKSKKKMPFFHEKTAKIGCFFGQKLSFLASDKQLNDPLPPFSRVLDAKKQVVGTHR